MALLRRALQHQLFAAQQRKSTANVCGRCVVSLRHERRSTNPRGCGYGVCVCAFSSGGYAAFTVRNLPSRIHISCARSLCCSLVVHPPRTSTFGRFGHPGARLTVRYRLTYGGPGSSGDSALLMLAQVLIFHAQNTYKKSNDCRKIHFYHI